MTWSLSSYEPGSVFKALRPCGRYTAWPQSGLP